MKKLLIVILAILLLAGCSQQQPIPREMVILVDTSGSIEPESETQCINGILKTAERMDRGDKLTVIPITGDADVDSTGHVLRFQKPSHRTAYNSDLLKFSKQVQQSMADFRSWSIDHPTARTDIFGGIAMAQEEFTVTVGVYDRTLIVCSDFIEDDGQTNFKLDRRLSNRDAAVQYAMEKAKSVFPSAKLPATVRLGLLRSKELHSLDRQRRDAIKQFWLQYFKTADTNASFTTDGTAVF